MARRVDQHRARWNAVGAAALLLVALGVLSAQHDEVHAQRLTAQFPLKGMDGTPIANHRIPADMAGQVLRLPGAVPAGSASGDVTLVQFYDLNCPFCRRAAGDIDELMRTDRALKLLFVPYPILSAQSVEGGRVELALRELGADKFLEFRRRIYATRGTIDGARSLAVVKDMGLDQREIVELANAPKLTEMLKAHAQVASRLKLFATPSYVVHDVAIVGHPGLKTLRGAVNAVRKCKAVVC